MIKRIFLDTETTSANRFKCGVWQIGGVIQWGKKKVEEFHFECDVFSEDQIDDKALEMHGLTLQDIACKPDPIDVLAEFQKLLGKYVDKYDKTDKLYFINFGAEFDSEVLRQWFAKCGDDYYGSWFWHPPIDVMVLAMQDIIGKRHSLKNFKQGSVLDYYGINYSENNLHNADYDAKCAMELYYKIIGEAMPPVERNDDDIPF